MSRDGNCPLILKVINRQFNCSCVNHRCYLRIMEFMASHMFVLVRNLIDIVASAVNTFVRKWNNQFLAPGSPSIIERCVDGATFLAAAFCKNL